MQPRDLVTTASHTWARACLYQVVLDVLDDVGGADSDDTWIVVTGTEKRIWAPGYWFNQYDLAKKNQNRLSEATLECYRRIVNHMSRVFGDGPTGNYWRISTFVQMRDALNTKQTAKDTEIMQRQLLAAWLNFANGSVTWFGLVDTNRDGIVDTPFNVLMAESEALRLNPAATRAQLLAQEDKLKSANND